MNVVTASMLLLATIDSGSRAETSVPVLRMVDGTPRPARLVSADSDWQLTFAADDADKAISSTAGDVIAWGAPHEFAAGDLILLADGGVIVADLVSADAGVVHADSRSCGALKIPTARVRSVLFRLPAAGIKRDKFIEKAHAARLRSDQVWMTNGDTLDGAVAKIDDEAIHLARGERTVKLPIDNVTAVLFDSAVVAPAEHEGLHSVVGLVDGTRLVADRCVFSEEKAHAEILSGELSVKVPAAKIVFMQPRGSRAVYLSDLKPASYRHIPLLDLKWDFHTDANVHGGRLRCNSRLYLKGLGVHSASVLAYRVPKDTKRLVGRIGIDESAGRGGSVVFRVYVDDGTGKLKPRFESETMRGGQPPQDITIDLTGARQVVLMTDFADRADVLDHADWLDVAFVK